jgi:hypothetical protein
MNANGDLQNISCRDDHAAEVARFIGEIGQ